MIIATPVQILGKIFLDAIGQLGKITLFFIKVMRKIFTPPIYLGRIGKEFISIGFFSLPVIGFTAIFTGAVLALQSYTGFSRMNAESAIASIISISITRELGPVLAGLMLSGRIASAITAEIGSMKISEQIDALYTLNTDPIRYLIAPKIIIGTICLPILVLFADVIGVLGGYLVSIYKIGFEQHSYLQETIKYLEMRDVLSGIFKAGFFGFIVTFIGCFFGYHAKNGASGVGYAATQAVVTASIIILLTNYIITGLLFSQ
jgi:phospholipid/cholesterol/gamma-HCH transport system permease protein